MAAIELLQVAVFSAIAYLMGYINGHKVGYIKAIKSIPITVLKIDESLTLEEEDDKIICICLKVLINILMYQVISMI